jgi:plastocyanin
MIKAHWVFRLFFCLMVALPGVRAATFTVQTVGTNFSPSSLNIPAGSSVFFTNNTGGGHNVVGYNPASEPFCGGGIVGPGPICTVTFNTPGTYFYRCTPHSSGSGTSFIGMTGSITVAAVFVPPTVALTNPAFGSVFGAPARIVFGAEATASNATVTNVSFMLNSNIVGRATNAPFQFVLSNVQASLRFLQAAATDSRGVSATSTPVSVRIIAPPALVAQPSNDLMRISFPTVTNLSYVVQRSTGEITNWTDITTNRATATNQQFMETIDAGLIRFYRVSVQP